MKILVAQANSTVGDVRGNTNKVLNFYLDNYQSDADLIIFPELFLSGYGVGDLVKNKDFLESIESSIKELSEVTKNKKSNILIGAPTQKEDKIYNSALLIGNGEVLKIINKYHLPNYGEFDELRNFNQPNFYQDPIIICDHKVGLMICEDAWFDGVVEHHVKMGAELLISINCSPFDVKKQQKRVQRMQQVAKKFGKPFIYLNRYGADDCLIFDGGSFSCNSFGKLLAQPCYWEEKGLFINCKKKKLYVNNEQIIQYDELGNVYQAVMLGLKDYVEKNGFHSVLLGLSGGIDSAFISVVAADCLGSSKVNCLALPSHISSEQSFLDAEELAHNIVCNLDKIEIKEIYNSVEKSLSSSFKGLKKDVTEENIQARIRSLVLMAISNKFGSLLLATGNKSELAVGYSTLYGDMCGGFAPVKDLYKTEIYELAKWRNCNIPNNSKFKKLNVIPNSIIQKAPTAELSYGQKDEDTLPPYHILDKILFELIELDSSLDSIAKKLRLDLSLVKEIYHKLKSSEYKRKQGALGTKISIRDLSIQRRYPTTNLY